MRIQSIFIICTLFLSSISYSQTKKRVLFLGNSYTSVNNLPQMVADVALSTSDTLVFDSNAPGGNTLQQHSVNPVSLNKIYVGNWDYVVLQEQSQLPSFPLSQVQSDVFPYAKNLNDTIKKYNACAETMFYMTWGKKNGDASNCVSWPPVCTYQGMDSLLYERYMTMATDNNAVVSPVGAARNYIRANFPGIELYVGDESHPTVAGSYVAACCFYSVIFRKSPLLISNDYGLLTVDALNIRNAVKTIVYDSLSNWFIGKYDPIAGFTQSVVATNTLSFANQSISATTYHWDFGDGTSSSLENPTHTYANPGSYQVSLIASHCSHSDTLEMTINEQTMGIKENGLTGKLVEVYPNPSKDKLTILSPDIKEVILFSLTGQKMNCTLHQDGKTNTLDLSTISAGTYLLVITTSEGVFNQRIVKD